MDNYKQEDVEIDLINLFLHVIRKWKVILLLGILISSATFGFKYHTLTTTNAPIIKDIQIRKSALNAQLAPQQDYLNSSFLVKSPLKLFEARYSLAVTKKIIKKTKKHKEIEEYVEAELKDPLINLSKGIMFSENKFQLFQKDLKTTCKNKAIFYELFRFENVKNNSLDILVLANTEDNLNLLKKHIELLRDELSAKIGNDKIVINLTETSSRFADNGTGNAIKNAVIKNINDIKGKIAALDKQFMTINPDGFFSLSLKFGLFGLIGGLFLGFTIYSFIYVFQGRLRDKNYLQNAFDVRTIACLKTAFYKKTDNKELEKMIGSLKILCKDQKKVLAVSTLPASALTESLTAINQVMQDLAVNFEVVESCKVQEVNEADKVFILEKIDQSKLAAVVDEVNLVKNFSHNLLGVIYA